MSEIQEKEKEYHTLVQAANNVDDVADLMVPRSIASQRPSMTEFYRVEPPPPIASDSANNSNP